MGFLSLREQPEAPAPRLTRAEALFVSLGVHLLILLLSLYLPGWLPDSVLAFLSARPARSAAAEALDAANREAAKPPPIPLKFAYVKIPDDTGIEANPRARLASDLTRLARQEVPTPPDAQRLSNDPHSEGDTIDRVVPDPARPEGPESPEPVQEATPPEDLPGEAEGAGPLKESGIEPGPGLLGETPGRLAERPPVPSGDGRPPAGDVAGESGSSSQSEGLKRAITDIKAGEFKFRFDNPAYLRAGDYGTMSFDTQEFPWGDYARQIYVAIRNNWLARIPLAAREGISGWVCQRFVIARAGDVVEVRVVRPSSVPPFDNAAASAIRASSPLPPLPEEFPASREGVTFCFFYNMYPEEAG